MRKTLKSLLLSIPLLFGIPTQADDIYLTPQDNWWNIISTSIGTSKNPTNIHLDVGVYENLPHRIEYLQVQDNVNLEGVVGVEDLFIDTKDWTPTTGASTVINNAVFLNGANEVRNIIFTEGHFPSSELRGEGSFFYIHDNHFINNSGDSLVIYPINGIDTLIDNNIFYNCEVGLSNAGGTTMYSSDSRIRNNKFLKCNRALFTSWDLDIGKVDDDGNNVFMSDINVVNYSGLTIPAQLNYWYDKDGNLLKDETSIQATIDNVTSLKQNKSISHTNVVPFQTQEFFQVYSAVDNFDLYK